MSTIGDYLSLPARDTGVWPASGATAWVYGSWVQLIDELDSGIYIAGIQFQIGVIPASLDTTMQQLFEVSTGSSGAEVVKIQIPYSIRMDTAVGFYKSSGCNSVYFPELLFIPAGSRISIRAVDSIAASINYEGFKLIYREIVDPVVTVSGLADGVVITDRTPSYSFTGSSTDGLNLEYNIQISKNNSFSTDFYALSQTTRNWYGIAIDSSNQDVYSAVFGGDIYKQTGGAGNFVALGQTVRSWSAVAIDSSTKDIYASVSGTDIYKLNGSTGNFTALGQAGASGLSLAIDSTNHNVYSGANGVDIYLQTGGIGDFVALGAGALIWSGIAVDSVTKDVYACINGGDIYKQTGGAGSFVALSQPTRSWVGISIDSSNHNVYAIVNVGDLYIQYGGLGDFIPQGLSVKGWSGVAVDSVTHDVYAVQYYLDIFKRADPAMLLEKKSPSCSDFIDVTNGANLHPFPTGEQISYSINPSDILGPGMYYWRVAARDPLGTNYYRSWTTPRSFTILTGPKVCDSSNWDYKPLKVWNGNTWVQKPIKTWDGSSWIIKG